LVSTDVITEPRQHWDDDDFPDGILLKVRVVEQGGVKVLEHGYLAVMGATGVLARPNA
jgi:hypothetical protein